MNNWTVYIHISPSNKVYVGITKRTLSQRFKNGEGYISCPLFYKAIQKYGWNNFQHIIILENISQSEAKYTEKYLIRWYKMHNQSYNITDGGQGMAGVRMYGEKNHWFGKHHSKWSKQKISQAQSGKNNNMYGTKAPTAIKINGKYLTDWAKELKVSYKLFYQYFIRHKRDLNVTIEYYKSKIK